MQENTKSMQETKGGKRMKETLDKKTPTEKELIDCLPAFPPRHLLKDKKRLRELGLHVWREKQKAKHKEYLGK